MILRPEPLCEVKLHTEAMLTSFFCSQYAHIQETQGRTRESLDWDGKAGKGYITKAKPTLLVSLFKNCWTSLKNSQARSCGDHAIEYSVCCPVLIQGNHDNTGANTA